MPNTDDDFLVSGSSVVYDFNEQNVNGSNSNLQNLTQEFNNSVQQAASVLKLPTISEPISPTMKDFFQNDTQFYNKNSQYTINSPTKFENSDLPSNDLKLSVENKHFRNVEVANNNNADIKSFDGNVNSNFNSLRKERLRKKTGEVKFQRPSKEALDRAAIRSRLPPNKFSELEKMMFPKFFKEVILRRGFIELRNCVLLLWLLNPKKFISFPECFEKVGLILGEGGFEFSTMLSIIWNYLHRYRFINFGLFESPNIEATLETDNQKTSNLIPKKKKINIIIIGAGISGITTAREIQNIFIEAPEAERPNIIVLEARQRVGGRIFTFPLSSKFPNITKTPGVDLAAQIVTGFEGGNPLDVIIRSQLQLGLYYLKNASICPLHDIDGRPTDKEEDQFSERVFNECLNQACNSVLINGQLKIVTPLEKKFIASKTELNLSLGEVIDHYLQNHSSFSELSESQLRMFHWHQANLEFANATTLNNLSLHHWDQDDGYEFGGHHSMLKNGFGQVPEALKSGNKIQKEIKVKFNKIVDSIDIINTADGISESSTEGIVKVTCRDESEFEADAVVISIPLGTLKQKAIKFSPELPLWKSQAIERMGFGWFNKVVFVFPEVFWDPKVDVFGSVGSHVPGEINEYGEIIYDPISYASNRGRNLVSTTGLPVLVSFVSGWAAVEMESESDAVIVNKAMTILAKILQGKRILNPIETIVTRWSKDEFSRGSYSYVANGSSGDDYDALGLTLWDKLFWAGEATNRHYPATVHGAYISGLRVATDISNRLLGPINDTNFKKEIFFTNLKKSKYSCWRKNCEHIIDERESLFDHISKYHQKTVASTNINSSTKDLNDPT
ncbi:hypothetical protein HDU92_003400 [Lobulomyces angularis]|nr:hypothetical protein HDU92_003400 [Lobulomyces angularis]